MTDDELLAKIKNGLGITGTYQDATLGVYIADVKQFLIDAGISSEIVNGSESVGVILRGVTDLWNYGSGSGTLSEYFMQRAIQLSYKADIKEVEEMDNG